MEQKEKKAVTGERALKRPGTTFAVQRTFVLSKIKASLLRFDFKKKEMCTAVMCKRSVMRGSMRSKVASQCGHLWSSQVCRALPM